MKKLLIVAALALSSVAALAADITGTVKYDYDRAESTPVWVSGHRVTTGLKAGFGSFGAADLGFVGSDVVLGGNRVNGLGYDIGYSNGVKFGKFGVDGRIGYSQVHYATLQGIGSVHTNIVSTAVNGTYAVSPTVTAVVGAEHLNGHVLGAIAAEGSANRYTVGANVALSKNVSLVAKYARTRAEGYDANGVTTAVSYKF